MTATEQRIFTLPRKTMGLLETHKAFLPEYRENNTSRAFVLVCNQMVPELLTSMEQAQREKGINIHKLHELREHAPFLPYIFNPYWQAKVDLSPLDTFQVNNTPVEEMRTHISGAELYLRRVKADDNLSYFDKPEPWPNFAEKMDENERLQLTIVQALLAAYIVLSGEQKSASFNGTMTELCTHELIYTLEYINDLLEDAKKQGRIPPDAHVEYEVLEEDRMLNARYYRNSTVNNITILGDNDMRRLTNATTQIANMDSIFLAVDDMGGGEATAVFTNLMAAAASAHGTTVVPERITNMFSLASSAELTLPASSQRTSISIFYKYIIQQAHITKDELQALQMIPSVIRTIKLDRDNVVNPLLHEVAQLNQLIPNTTLANSLRVYAFFLRNEHMRMQIVAEGFDPKVPDTYVDERRRMFDTQIQQIKRQQLPTQSEDDYIARIRATEKALFEKMRTEVRNRALYTFKNLGVHWFQGFYFHKPQPVA